MTLAADEFIRRFLLHVLPPQPFQRCFASPEPWAAPPKGFHRIRHVACPGLDPGACSPAPPERPVSTTSASCSGSRRSPTPSAGRPAGCPPAMPMLRRPHGRHRHLRTLVPTTCPAARRPPNRDHQVMTRHGPASSPPVAPALPAMMPLALPKPPLAPASLSCPGFGQRRCRTPLQAAMSPAADACADSRRAHLTTGPNPKTP